MKQITLADEEVDYRTQVMQLLVAWFATKLLATASYAIGQSVNSGRNSMWADDDLLEYSAIIDGRTSAGCSALDGKVMTWAQWQANPEYLPPRHFGCRATLVKISDSVPKDQIVPPNKEQVDKIDHILRTPKPQLIEENPFVAQYTKAELLSVEAYKGNGYININQVLLGQRPMNEYAEADIKQLDKAIKKMVLEKDTVLYRGIGMKKQLKPGDYVDHPNYASTSFSYESALSFSKNADYKKYLLEFRAPKGMPYLDTEKVMDANGLTTLVEDEYLLSRGKVFVVRGIEVYNNGIQRVIVDMTDDTKYLSDKETTKVSPEEQKKFDEAWAKLEAEEKAGKKPSRVVKRLHHIWQMESDYFNNNPDAIKSADETEK